MACNPASGFPSGAQTPYILLVKDRDRGAESACGKVLYGPHRMTKTHTHTARRTLSRILSKACFQKRIQDNILEFYGKRVFIRWAILSESQLRTERPTDWRTDRPINQSTDCPIVRMKEPMIKTLVLSNPCTQTYIQTDGVADRHDRQDRQGRSDEPGRRTHRQGSWNATARHRETLANM